MSSPRIPAHWTLSGPAFWPFTSHCHISQLFIVTPPHYLRIQEIQLTFPVPYFSFFISAPQTLPRGCSSFILSAKGMLASSQSHQSPRGHFSPSPEEPCPLQVGFHHRALSSTQLLNKKLETLQLLFEIFWISPHLAIIYPSGFLNQKA